MWLSPLFQVSPKYFGDFGFLVCATLSIGIGKPKSTDIALEMGKRSNYYRKRKNLKCLMLQKKVNINNIEKKKSRKEKD